MCEVDGQGEDMVTSTMGLIKCVNVWKLKRAFTGAEDPGASICSFLKFPLFIYFGERERERGREQVGERQREGVTESETGSRPRAVSTEPDVGLELRTVRS